MTPAAKKEIPQNKTKTGQKIPELIFTGDTAEKKNRKKVWKQNTAENRNKKHLRILRAEIQESIPAARATTEENRRLT